MGISAARHMTRVVPLLAEGISRRENAVVYRAGFSNEADPLAFGLWDELNNLAHVCSY